MMTPDLVISVIVGLLLTGGLFLGGAIWLWCGDQPHQSIPDPVITRLQAEREAYRYLTYNVAHDVSNPLQSILVILENLAECSIDDEAHWRQLQTILRTELDHLIKVTEEAKLLAHLNAPEAPIVRERVNLERVVADVIFALGARAEREGSTIIYHGIPRPPLILGDAQQLKQVIMNLTDNALKYVRKPGGEVVITITTHPHQIELAVSDNGLGLTPEQITRLWDAPFQPRDARTRHIHGTGLGLAIVKRIIVQHQGSIVVQSVLGEGSTFVLCLPLPTAVPRSDSPTKTWEKRNDQTPPHISDPTHVGNQTGAAQE